MRRLPRLEFQDDTLPFHGRFLEIHQETDTHAGGSQVVQTLRHVLVGQTLDTLQFDNECLFHEEVGEVLPYRLSFVSHREGSLGDRRDAPDADSRRSARW